MTWNPPIQWTSRRTSKNEEGKTSLMDGICPIQGNTSVTPWTGSCGSSKVNSGLVTKSLVRTKLDIMNPIYIGDSEFFVWSVQTWFWVRRQIHFDQVGVSVIKFRVTSRGTPNNKKERWVTSKGLYETVKSHIVWESGSISDLCPGTSCHVPYKSKIWFLSYLSTVSL